MNDTANIMELVTKYRDLYRQCEKAWKDYQAAERAMEDFRRASWKLEAPLTEARESLLRLIHES